jgi:hypothetical protein
MNARATRNIDRRSRALPGGSLAERTNVRHGEEGGPRGKHGFPRASCTGYVNIVEAIREAAG